MNYGYKPTWLSRGAHTVQWTCFFYKGVIPPKSVLIVFSWHYRLACWNHTAPYRHQPFFTMEIVVKALPHEIVTLSHGTSGTFILCSTSFFLCLAEGATTTRRFEKAIPWLHSAVIQDVRSSKWFNSWTGTGGFNNQNTPWNDPTWPNVQFSNIGLWLLTQWNTIFVGMTIHMSG